ncbi:MAG: T9SS type A sorting domain-containing protein, partial [Sodaliphilus sp.]
WFILEPINVEAGYYALKFWYSGDDNHPEKFSVHYGSAATPEAMTNKIVEYAPFAKGAYQESINILHFDSPQTVYIGFYAFSDKDENWITIDDLSLEKIEATDVDVATISLINPTEYLPVKAPQDVTFVAKNMGITAQTVSVAIKVDDASTQPVTVNFAAQEERTLNFSGALSGLKPGAHTLEVALSCEGDINHANDTIRQSFIFLGTPDIIYDFEDGKVPAEFTYEVNDEGTLNSSAAEEFGENGWGIVSIGEHPYYGTKMFAGSSWIDGVDEINRSCILPKVTVNSDSAYFVWNAGSISPYFYESYQVRVRYIDPIWGPDYSKLAEITLEGTDRQYRGVNLGKFNGQEVQVELRMTSKPGDALTFDNLQFVGCSLIEPSGINEALASNALKMAVANNFITLNANASITVTDMSGRIVASGTGSTLSISHLNAGAYVVTARTATATTTKKFIR